ncbi:UbiA prenyltransferase [Calothrix sp. NIES-4071]|nr:UbiA prenyltransferase [Calothrix sp. NIES-4071]BAZ60007.1 UbiA prenyltransferase [Calothrix sp. NIES-4105]
MTTTIVTTNRFWAYLQLMRPANVITAWADILAGVAASGLFSTFYEEIKQGVVLVNFLPLGYLLIATSCLYSGGVVLNDAFDANLDAVERPERPIPSGRASRQGAFFVGSLLLCFGIVFAWVVSPLSAILATFVAVAAVMYDAFGKHHALFGPLNMGACRGANLLLGLSIVPGMVSSYWFLALIPIIYIAAVTNLSRGEVEGGNTVSSIVSIVLMSTVFAAILGLGLFKNSLLAVFPFALLLAIRVFPPLFTVLREPSPAKIQLAIRACVLSMIVLNATLSTSFAGLLYGLLVLVLLPVSMKLASLFAVT